MAYRLDLDHPASSALRSVAAQQVERALTELADGDLGTDRKVHQVRKRCKKLRGLLRLARKRMGGRYPRENARLRAIARRLAPARDATVLVATVDDLLDSAGGPVADDLASLRQKLEEYRRAEHRQGTDVETLLARVRGDLEALGGRIEHWDVDREGFEAFRTGFKKTYRRGRKAMKRAFKSSADEDFHEWRKRVKYHWYHVRLLRDSWKPVMAARADQLDELGDLLGIHHDLAVLRRRIDEDLTLVARDRERRTRVVTLIDQRQRRIEADCLRLGRLLCAEKPATLTHRVQSYWNVQADG